MLDENMDSRTYFIIHRLTEAKVYILGTTNQLMFFPYARANSTQGEVIDPLLHYLMAELTTGCWLSLFFFPPNRTTPWL